MYFCEYLYYINIPYRSRLGGRQNPPSVTELNNSSGSILSAHQPTSTFAKLTGVLKSAFRLWSNPFPRVLSLMAHITKKLPKGSFFVLVRAQGLASPPLRSFAKLTGVLKSAFRLWSNPFSRVLSLMALKTKNSHSGVLFYWYANWTFTHNVYTFFPSRKFSPLLLYIQKI